MAYATNKLAISLHIFEVDEAIYEDSRPYNWNI
jgi:hypothetical protein